jgi:dTDP-4-dehydrorhamnose 3,5-epimerase
MFIKKIDSFEIEDLKLITLSEYHDHRGSIRTIYSEDKMFPKFVEDKISLSKKNVLRGLHGDSLTNKLISCLYGSLTLVVVDARIDSKSYGKVQKFDLSKNIGQLVYVPAGCLNGHICTSEECIFWYKWSEHYSGPEKQVTIKWDDPELKIDWPCKDPVLSERDKNGVAFKGIKL